MYSGNGLKASAGYEALDNQAGGISAGAGNEDMKTWQLGASYTMNAFSFGGVYQDTTSYKWVNNRDYTAWALTGKWTAGNNAVALLYTNSKDKQALGDVKTDGWGISGEHNFSKRSKVYAAYAYNKEKPILGSDVKDQVFSLGMIHNF
jgi:predicted porin